MPEPRAAAADERGQALRAAARRVDPVVVDDVVAVVAAGLGLEQRREVDPVDAEVAQVGQPAAAASCRSKSAVICSR